MNAVGMDVSKGKNTVTIRRPGNVVILIKEFDNDSLCTPKTEKTDSKKIACYTTKAVWKHG